MPATLKDKVMFITGASRGIGREIALKCAKDGAKIVLAAKTAEPHPKLPHTIFSVAEEIKALGGEALALVTDIRFEEQVEASVAEALKHFGGIDILINDASAISLTDTLNTDMKKFDLMFSINIRGTYLCSQKCIPHLSKSENPHILNLSPPLNMKEKWFKNHVAYTISKYGMSMCTLGMSAELKDRHIAVNSLWPKTTIATSAIELVAKQIYGISRKPTIVADAAYWILTQDSKKISGNFFIDEEVLQNAGISDFSGYSMNPEVEPPKDFFLD